MTPASRLRLAAERLEARREAESLPPTVAAAFATWLRQAVVDEWAHGRPDCCESGCVQCDDDLLAPHLRAALAVADAVLGETVEP